MNSQGTRVISETLVAGTLMQRQLLLVRGCKGHTKAMYQAAAMAGTTESGDIFHTGNVLR